MNVRRISQGVLRYLHHTEGARLYEIMDRAESEGMLIPGVSGPWDCLPGDGDDHLYAFACLKVLDFHVRNGQVRAVFGNEHETEVWRKWRSGELGLGRLRRPDGLDPSFSYLRPKAAATLVRIALRLSEQTLTKSDEGRYEEILHLDRVKSPLFLEPGR